MDLDFKVKEDPAPKPEKKPSKYSGQLKMILTFAGLSVIVLIIGSIYFDSIPVVDEQELRSSGVVSTSFEKFNSAYDDLTKVQQEDFRKKHKGDKVQWTGKIVDVTEKKIEVDAEGLFGTMDFVVYLTDKSDMGRFRKDQKITVRGTLDRDLFNSYWEVHDGVLK